MTEQEAHQRLRRLTISMDGMYMEEEERDQVQARHEACQIVQPKADSVAGQKRAQPIHDHRTAVRMLAPVGQVVRENVRRCPLQRVVGTRQRRHFGPGGWRRNGDDRYCVFAARHQRRRRLAMQGKDDERALTA
jgi:hypothetical protein